MPGRDVVPIPRQPPCRAHVEQARRQRLGHPELRMIGMVGCIAVQWCEHQEPVGRPRPQQRFVAARRAAEAVRKQYCATACTGRRVHLYLNRAPVGAAHDNVCARGAGGKGGRDEDRTTADRARA